VRGQILNDARHIDRGRIEHHAGAGDYIQGAVDLDLVGSVYSYVADRDHNLTGRDYEVRGVNRTSDLRLVSAPHGKRD
jgi:hypothetical protein